MVWYSHLFQISPQLIVIHTVKGFGIVNKAEINVFLELFCFFDDPADVGNLISDSSAFSKTSLNIWKFMVHVLLKPGLEILSITLLPCVLGCNLKNDRMISVCFQGKPFNIKVIQAYAPTINAEEDEVEWFYDHLQDLLELTQKKMSFS